MCLQQGHCHMEAQDQPAQRGGHWQSVPKEAGAEREGSPLGSAPKVPKMGMDYGPLDSLQSRTHNMLRSQPLGWLPASATKSQQVTNQHYLLGGVLGHSELPSPGYPESQDVRAPGLILQCRETWAPRTHFLACSDGQWITLSKMREPLAPHCSLLLQRQPLDPGEHSQPGSLGARLSKDHEMNTLEGC